MQLQPPQPGAAAHQSNGLHGLANGLHETANGLHAAPHGLQGADASFSQALQPQPQPRSEAAPHEAFQQQPQQEQEPQQQQELQHGLPHHLEQQEQRLPLPQLHLLSGLAPQQQQASELQHDQEQSMQPAGQRARPNNLSACVLSCLGVVEPATVFTSLDQKTLASSRLA